jgi:hypothetical protein
MAHWEQQLFVQSVKASFPSFFKGGRIIEIGSLDINGTVRGFFEEPAEYIGVDLGPGRGVDVVCEGQDYDGATNSFDVAISVECFEHNPHWKATFLNMVRMVRDEGLVVMTCATTGRPEHGTSRSDAGSSPLTVGKGWEYYKNLTEADFREAFDMNSMFEDYCFNVNTNSHDLYFWGLVKK